MNLKTLSFLAASIAVLAVGGVAIASRGADDVRQVRPGESIQAAIDAAAPGDTIVVAPGVYRENLSIRKDGLTLRGAGSGPGGTVLRPPALADVHPSECNEYGEVNGICIAGVFTPGRDELGKPVLDTRVSGFAVAGFSRFGIVTYNARNTTVSDNIVTKSGHFGIVAFEVKGLRLLDNRSADNGEAGFYLADAAAAGAVIQGNTSSGNTSGSGIGMYLRDASGAIVSGNHIERNCVGILLVDTAAGGPASHWMLKSNTVRHNSAACAPTEDVPVPLSGFGIAVLGARDTVVEANLVEGNRPSGDSAVAGGIALVSAKDVGGPDPTGTIVRGNTARGNEPADLVTDGSGQGNRFTANHCATSIPQGLC